MYNCEHTRTAMQRNSLPQARRRADRYAYSPCPPLNEPDNRTAQFKPVEWPIPTHSRRATIFRLERIRQIDGQPRRRIVLPLQRFRIAEHPDLAARRRLHGLNLERGAWLLCRKAVDGAVVFRSRKAKRIALAPELSLSGTSGVDALPAGAKPSAGLLQLGYSAGVEPACGVGPTPT